LKNFEYFDPKTVGEAVSLLQQHAGKVKVLAGGTDLFLRMRHRALMPDVVVDVKRIPELAQLSYADAEGLRLGSTVTHTAVAENAAVRQHYGALACAASWVGSLQTRHRGTVVGNLCNASPAADTAPALVAYRAIVDIAGPNGNRDVPIDSFFEGPGRTALGPGEMVTGLRLPPQGPHGWGFLRRTRTAIDIALVSACAVIRVDKGVCTDVSLSLGAVGPTPLRVAQAEALLRGQRPTAALVTGTARSAAAEARPISDVRCSAAYRKDMAEVLLRRCIQAALGMQQIKIDA
jgi:carbon-monoxide dehydrogenase medium subunit